MTLGLVVTAGGHGSRLGLDGPKQYLPLLGVPMVQRTIAALDACEGVDALVVVVNPEDVSYCTREIVAERFDKVVDVVGGGSERSISVRNGLDALAAAGPFALLGVHDGARPLIGCGEIEAARRRLAADETLDGVIVGIPSIDTIKLVDGAGVVRETPDRGRVWQAQTPQIFRAETLRRAYAAEEGMLRSATDDSSLVERLGGRVALVEGLAENLKVTRPLDVRLAEFILAERRR